MQGALIQRERTEGGRNNALSAGGQCLSPLVGGDHWSSPASYGARPGGSVQVRGHVTGRAPLCLPTCGVGHAWTLGLVHRLVTLSKLLLQ